MLRLCGRASRPGKHLVVKQVRTSYRILCEGFHFKSIPSTFRVIQKRAKHFTRPIAFPKTFIALLESFSSVLTILKCDVWSQITTKRILDTGLKTRSNHCRLYGKTHAIWTKKKTFWVLGWVPDRCDQIRRQENLSVILSRFGSLTRVQWGCSRLKLLLRRTNNI